MTITFRPWAKPQIARRPICRGSALGNAWSRATRWIIAPAIQVFPVIAVFAIFAAFHAATIAFRLAIWLPLHYRP